MAVLRRYVAPPAACLEHAQHAIDGAPITRTRPSHDTPPGSNRLNIFGKSKEVSRMAGFSLAVWTGANSL
ncbi:MAG: hypothetical protein ACE5GT_06350, partial [Rhodospirillales bacterium]